MFVNAKFYLAYEEDTGQTVVLSCSGFEWYSDSKTLKYLVY
jgi:hypothetical protein